YIEVVFSSQACVNASFLLPEDQHYCCSSRNHGLDINVAEKAFTSLSRVENMSIKELIMNCVIINLIPTLVPSPPDVETLRVYVTLPLYHEFDNPKHYNVLQNPFGSAVLKLKTEAAKVL
ncbi:unnamed protein product, partial [Timema podura]|nr:unnamed protein product [Timema podura]